MPFLAPVIGWLAADLPALAAVGSLAGAGVGIGETVANAGNKLPTVATPQPTPPSANQLLQQREAVASQVPNEQASGSGTLSPDFESIMAQILAGTIGQPGSTAAGQSATGQQFQTANNQPTNAAVNGQPVNLSDFINSFSG